MNSRKALALGDWVPAVEIDVANWQQDCYTFGIAAGYEAVIGD